MEREKLLEFIKTRVRVENWEQESTGKKETHLYLFYPDENGRLFYQVYTTPEPDQEQSALKVWFQVLADEITRSQDWKKKKRVWEMCSEMLCGDNPCSCRCEDDNHSEDCWYCYSK